MKILIKYDGMKFFSKIVIRLGLVFSIKIYLKFNKMKLCQMNA